MRLISRRARAESEESESYYVSMTDMMVGVLFIFIIMLAYFALQFHKTTLDLTQPKDAQTAVLLKAAQALQHKTADIEVDSKAHVLCVRGDTLGASDSDRHCFAYSGSLPKAPATPQDRAQAERATLVGQLESDFDSQKLSATGSATDGNLSFPADQLFLPNSTTLSPAGAATAQKVAAILMQRLPCYASAQTPEGCSNGGMRMTSVNIVVNASFDAYTEQGRALAALALQRSVAFHNALVQAQPLLGQLKDASGGQPLLQVASWGQSQVSAPADGNPQNLYIAFNMAAQ